MNAFLGGVRCRAVAVLGAAAALTWIVESAMGATPPAPAQKHFASPEQATEALVGAARGDDQQAMLSILGPEADDVLSSGDPVADANARKRFLESYEKKHTLQPAGDDKVVVAIGDDDWPFPIPLVKEADGWRFDTEQGREELIDRRIGRNELAAIKVAQAFVDAQREYYERNPEGGALRGYAQKIASSEGKRDGLYWPEKEGEETSPLGPAMARARAEGYTGAGKGAVPYHGYYYRILTAQGPHAKGGAYDYVVKGKMLGGFALVAYPAEYGVSGVMTFLVNHDGVVFEKDLGPKTVEQAKAMKRFDPDETWKKVSEDPTTKTESEAAPAAKTES
jgi:hypothetical protein